MSRSYIIRDDGDGTGCITCFTCGYTSWNDNDVKNHYCGFCRVFLDDPEPDSTPQDGNPAEYGD